MSPVTKTAFWFFGLPVLFFLALPYIVAGPPSNINKNVWPAFREIEYRCMAEHVSDSLSDSCAHALHLITSCVNFPDSCPAAEYHERLTSLGFTLPPLYLASQTLPRTP